MKIISKYKDYYDYLKGVYGEDSKLVLDRRTNNGNLSYLLVPGKLEFHICNKVYDCLYFNNQIYSGKDIIDNFPKNVIERTYWDDNKTYYQLSNIFIRSIDFSKEIYYSKYNKELNCPILLVINNDKSNPDFLKYPKLIDFKFYKVIKAHDIWVMLSEWLSSMIIEPEILTDNNIKIESHGFDIKTSFRPKIK